MKRLLLSFLLCGLIISSCQKQYSFNEDVATTPTVNNNIFADDTTIFYYQATIEGERYTVLSGGDGHTTSSGSRSGTNKNEGVILMSTIVPTPTSTGLTIQKGILKNYSSLTEDQFRSFFPSGDYSFTKFSFNNPTQAPEGLNGFTINWIDKQNTTWRTDIGSGDQTGSFIKIISQNRVISFGEFILQLRVVIEFNCILYDSAGHSKKITNGKAALYFPKTI